MDHPASLTARSVPLALIGAIIAASSSLALPAAPRAASATSWGCPIATDLAAETTFASNVEVHLSVRRTPSEAVAALLKHEPKRPVYREPIGRPLPRGSVDIVPLVQRLVQFLRKNEERRARR